MCQHKDGVYTCGDSWTTLSPCPYALDNKITVMACPYYVREPEKPEEGDCPLCVEEAELRTRKAKRIRTSYSEISILRAGEGKGKGIDRKTHPNYPTILEEDEEDEAEAEAEQEGKGKGIDRKAHPNYPTILEEGEEDEAEYEIDAEAEAEDRPTTRAIQRERPVAEPRTTPLKRAEPKTLVRKMSEKVKQLARTLSKKKDE